VHLTAYPNCMQTAAALGVPVVVCIKADGWIDFTPPGCFG